MTQQREGLFHEDGPDLASAPSGAVLVVYVPMGKVHMELLDGLTHEPIAGRGYRLTGASGKTLAGATDAQGRLLHADLPIDEYALAVDGEEEQLRALMLDPADPEPLRRYLGAQEDA